MEQLDQLEKLNEIEQLKSLELSDESQFVAFKIADQEYGVDINLVQEIIRWDHITRVPKAPHYIKGVINLRGNVIPILDSHIRFNLPEQEVSNSSRIVIFDIDEMPVGMTVDMVTEVVRLPEEQIEKAQSFNSVDGEFIQGIGKVDSRLIILLDLYKVLDIEAE